MEYRTRDDISPVSQVLQPASLRLSRSEKLLRWAAALDSLAGQPLQALRRLEFLDRHERPGVREDNSPLTVAWKDPVLQAEGLGSDQLGDAQQFFELTDDLVHDLLCDCHFHGTLTATLVSARLRAMAQHYPAVC